MKRNDRFCDSFAKFNNRRSNRDADTLHRVYCLGHTDKQKNQKIK